MMFAIEQVVMEDGDTEVTIANEYGDSCKCTIRLPETGAPHLDLVNLLESAYALGAKEQATRFQRRAQDAIPTATSLPTDHE